MINPLTAVHKFISNIPADASTLLGTALASVAGVVGVLWRALQKKTEKMEKRTEEQTQQIIALTSKVGKLEGRQDGVAALADRVLEEIREAVTPPKENNDS